MCFVSTLKINAFSSVVSDFFSDQYLMIYQGLDEIEQKILLNAFSRSTPPCAASEEADGGTG